MTPARLALFLLAAVGLGIYIGAGLFPTRRSDDVADTDDTRAFDKRVRSRMSGEAQHVERAEMSVVGS